MYTEKDGRNVHREVDDIGGYAVAITLRLLYLFSSFSVLLSFSLSLSLFPLSACLSLLSFSLPLCLFSLSLASFFLLPFSLTHSISLPLFLSVSHSVSPSLHGDTGYIYITTRLKILGLACYLFSAEIKGQQLKIKRRGQEKKESSLCHSSVNHAVAYSSFPFPFSHPHNAMKRRASVGAH